jgi:hypothetical protein
MGRVRLISDRSACRGGSLLAKEARADDWESSGETTIAVILRCAQQT